MVQVGVAILIPGIDLEVVASTVGHGGIDWVVLYGTNKGGQGLKPSERFYRRANLPCSTYLRNIY